MKKNQDNTTISNVSTDLIKKRKKRRIGYTALGVLGVGIAAGAFFTLRHFGSALNHTIKVVDCAETSELHEHDDSCYGFDEFDNEILVCGYADYVVHTHNQYCYNDDDELICKLPEIEAHEHDDSCYEEIQVLVCDLPEGEGEDEFIDDTASDIVSDDVSDDAVVEDTFTEDEVLVDDADMIIEDGETPLAAVAHYHDDSCYETRKILVCGKLELHTHDDSCFDEYGALICGIPELKEHEHTSDCVTKRELTDEEIAALDRADPNEKTQPKEHTLTYECDEYVVIVTYTDLANIPEGAELVVKEITENDAQYQKLQDEVAELVSSDDAAADDASDDAAAASGEVTIYKSLDISFVFEGEEIEPADEVKVEVNFKENDFTDDDQMTIIHHKDTGSEVIDTQAVDEDGKIDFATDSFSIYTFAKASKPITNLPEGKYDENSYNGYFEYSYNDTQNAFLTDKYARYRVDNGAMGQVASSFHVVAFDTATLGVHTNGNVLCDTLDCRVDDWGTNAKDYAIPEVSYFKNTKGKIGERAEQGRGTAKDGQPAERVIALGSSIQTESDWNHSQLKVGNGNDKSKLTRQTAAKYIVHDKDSANAPFIDLGQVYQEVQQISKNLASQGNINTVADFSDQNNRYIKITDPSVAGYYNIKASDLNNASGTPLQFVGFETSDKSSDIKKALPGSLIVNVDCRGQKYISVASEWKVKFNCNYDNQGRPNGGTDVSRTEVVDFSGGKVIFNFYNAERGTQINLQNVCGVILAPDCDISVNNGNGNFICQNFVNTGETHRSDFTGTTVPFSAGLTAFKTVDGRTPYDNEKFDFGLFERQGNSWQLLQTKQNSGKDIIFDNITYGKPSDVGTHWYMIRETSSGSSRYTYDTGVYFIKTVVTERNGTYNATSTYYKDTYRDNIAPAEKNPVDATAMTFNNLDSTSIKVDKVWLGADGNEITDYTNLPDSITVALYQTDGNGEGKQYGDKVKLTKAQKYTYTWDPLPRQSDAGNMYSYYVVEDPVEGFDNVSDTSVKISDGTYTITNKKQPKKISLSVDKEFFLGDERVLNPAITTADEDGYVKFRLLYTYEGLGKWETQDVFPTNIYPDNNGEKGQGNGTYRLDKNNGWHIDITGLPAEGMKDGKYVTYQYDVVETECNLSAFEYKYSVPNKKVEVGREGASVVTGGADANGNYEFIIADYTDDTTSIEIDKYWFTVKGDHDSIEKGANENVVIGLKLYNESNVEEYYQMSYDKFVAVDSSGNTISSKYTISDVSRWSAKISGLPRYYVKDGKLAKASYKIEELTDENGFTYDEFVQDGDAVYNDDDPNMRVVTLNNRNTVTYDLPATGGRGTLGGAVTKWLNGHLN